MTHRLFVAARPPLGIRLLLHDAMGDVAGAHWQDDDQLHLTLRFIGEVDARTADDVVEALASVRAPVCISAISGVGQFASKHGNALWAGLANKPGLTALHTKIDRALTRIGLEPEHRAYHPHITLARLPRRCGDLSGWLARNGTLSSEDFTIGEFGLYESHLGGDGARYDLVAHWTLAPAAAGSPAPRGD